jgi:hypothetical protein
MKSALRMLLLLLVIATIAGCGYTAYLGMHGKSIRYYPDVHEAVTQDQECLECHYPNNDRPDSDQPVATPHPKFTGCLKCHNDNVEPAS